MYFSRPLDPDAPSQSFQYAADPDEDSVPENAEGSTSRSVRKELAAITIQKSWRGQQARMESGIRKEARMWKVIANTPTTGAVPQSTVFSPRVARHRARLYFLLEDPSSGNGAKIVAVCILTVIIISIASLILETMPELKQEDTRYYVSSVAWESIEIGCTLLFTIEFILRVLVCNVIHPAKIFFTSPMAFIDFIAIAPFYIELALTTSPKESVGFLRVLRATRLTRFFRIFKLGRYSSGLHVMGSALIDSLNALYVLVFFLSIGVVLFSSILYYAEKLQCPSYPDPQEDVEEWAKYQQACDDLASVGIYEHPTYGLCCNVSGKEHSLATYVFPDIVQTFWWSIVTMTTCGYGDKVPQTVAGKLMATVSMLCGILLIALPVAIVGRNFQDAYEKMEKETSLDRSTVATTREFKAKMDTFPKPQRPPLSVLADRLSAVNTSGNIAVASLVKDVAQLLGQTQTISETLYKLQCAELLRQDEIFDSMEQLLRYVKRRSYKK